MISPSKIFLCPNKMKIAFNKEATKNNLTSNRTTVYKLCSPLHSLHNSKPLRSTIINSHHNHNPFLRFYHKYSHLLVKSMFSIFPTNNHPLSQK
jgi:hypothetical protein